MAFKQAVGKVIKRQASVEEMLHGARSVPLSRKPTLESKLATARSTEQIGADDFENFLKDELAALSTRIQKKHESLLTKTSGSKLQRGASKLFGRQHTPTTPTHDRVDSSHKLCVVSDEYMPAVPDPLPQQTKRGKARMSMADAVRAVTKAKKETIHQHDGSGSKIDSNNYSPCDDVLPFVPEHDEIFGDSPKHNDNISEYDALGDNEDDDLGNYSPSGIATEFELRSIWQNTELEVTQVATMLVDFDMSDSGSENESTKEVQVVSTAPTWKDTVPASVNQTLKCCLIDPNSRGKIMYDFLAFILVLYDCIMIPVSFFDFEISEIGWITRIFWTIDLIVYPLTTYTLPDGKLQDQPLKVIKHSLRNQIFKNLPLVAIDWLTKIVDGIKTAKLGKIAKAFRMTRLLRLWHLINSKELPESVRATLEYYFSSEIGLTVLSILKLLAVIIWVNHVIACLWYYVATNDDEDIDRNWVYLFGLRESDSMVYVYLTALHWSVTQFFCGAPPVAPTNVNERLFNVCVLFFAIMMSAFIISSLTTSMTRLSIVAAEESQKFAALKDFLSQNNISPRVALRVQRNASYALQQLRKHTPEENIDLLGLVSQPLRIELHFEVHMPAITKHPFFDIYAHECPELVRQLCHEGITQLSLSSGDLLFTQGVDSGVHMYFIVGGKLAYTQADILDDIIVAQRRTLVGEGEWACEAVLWTDWAHCGSMRAKAECQLKLMTSDVFLALSKKFKAMMSYPRSYGYRFVNFINKKKPSELSDLAYDDFDAREIAFASRGKRKRASVRADLSGVVPVNTSVNSGRNSSGTQAPADSHSFWSVSHGLSRLRGLRK